MAAERPELPYPARPGFGQFAAAPAGSPLVIAVPHAGRDYPDALLAAARLPSARLEAIEDRLVDRLVGPAVTATGAAAVIATRARAWIDLNRDPREIDPGMVEPAPAEQEIIRSAKVRGGLGLVPRRIAFGGEIWRRRLSRGEVDARIARDHAPYHAAIADHLATAQARFGVAVLLDCHSMPSLAPERLRPAPQIVVGDRFGRSAAAPLVDRALAVAARAGLQVAHNLPYPGGYSLDRHGDVGGGRHAIQIEIDRALYLDAAGRAPGQGFARIARLLAEIALELVGTALDGAALPQAAE